MPRPSKPPRLSLYKAKGRASMWTIRTASEPSALAALKGDRVES